MANSHLQSGSVIDHTPGSDVANGATVVMGALVGVALTAIPAGVPGPVQITDVWEFPKLSTDTFVQGAAVYWDAANTRMTSTSAGNTLAGRAAYAAGSGATSMYVGLKGWA